jgi:peptidoglycan/LPS O-acetylase OafA/YrhL
MSTAVTSAPHVTNRDRKSLEINEFRPDIQGLRAIAVGMVVIYHLFPAALPGGFAGVDVFFVISGYLITGHLWRGYARTGTVDVAGFWGRRARRLIPAAALVLTATWIASRIAQPAAQFADTAQQILASALYFQNRQLSANAVDYLKSADAATPVQHFWSLSVEEQFYLVWPLAFLLAAFLAGAFTSRRCTTRRCKPQGTDGGPDVRRARHVRAGLVGALTAALVAASLCYSVHETAANPPAAYFSTASRLWELGCGGLLAIAQPRPAGALSRQGWLGWLGLAAVIASAFTLTGSMAFPGVLALPPVLGTVALIAGGSAAGRFGPARLTSARPMVFIGAISYSLYLWHYPVINLYTESRGQAPGLFAGPVILAASVLLAWLTKTFVEDKVRRCLAGHRGRSLSVALAALVPAVLALVYLTGEPTPWNGKLGSDYPGAAALAGRAGHVPAAPVLPPPDQISQSVYRRAGCLDDLAASTPKPCAFGDTVNPVRTVALVGDSAAGEWFDALDAIAAQRHWKLVTELHSSCPWTAAVMLNPNGVGTFTACHAWGAAVLHDLVATIRPDAVLTSDYPNMGTPAHPARESPAAVAEIGAGMAQYWASLENAGISVTAIKESPDLGENVPACVERHSAELARCDVPRSTAVLRNSPVSEAAKQMRGTVAVVDANSLICGPKACAPVVGNVLVYSDNHHLTWYYSRSTAPFIEPLLLRANQILASQVLWRRDECRRHLAVPCERTSTAPAARLGGAVSVFAYLVISVQARPS